MDERFFEEILARGVGKEATISNVRITSKLPAVGKGENFLSEVWRFTLIYTYRDKFTRTAEDEFGDSEEKETMLIVKCQPRQQGPCLKVITDQNVFETETNVFKMILPETERMVEQPLVPRCLHHGATENQRFLVLEDLRPLGFRTKDRQKGLSFDHVLMVLRSIADFHATTVYQYEQNPERIKSFNEGIMTERTPKNIFRVMEQTLRMVGERCRAWPDPIFSRISDKLRILEEKFAGEVVDATNYDRTEFCVLNHGDCWINNIMFREDENGKPLRVMLIDFQMSVYTSPVIDLIYFLNVCPAIDIRTDNDDFFLAKYLERLTMRMKILKCETQIPTVIDFHRAIAKRRMWVVMSALVFYPRMIADPSEIETFDEIIDNGETRMDIFKNPNATIALQKSLKFMEKMGYLD